MHDDGCLMRGVHVILRERESKRVKLERFCSKIVVAHFSTKERCCQALKAGEKGCSEW